ncbi:hypothetical protein [Inediibacterium massiliense]|nr:hypothetical protein [Inediibacterium massiliense]
MLKFTSQNRICFIGKPKELLLFLNHLLTTYPQIRDIKKIKYYN